MSKSLAIEEVPAQLNGTIDLPASKSLSNRALILNALSNGAIPLQSLSNAADTKLLKELLESNDSTLDCQNAGTTLRFLTAYYALLGKEKVITGSERMKARPIGPLVEALNSLGAAINYLEKEGYPPIAIKGKPLEGGSIEMDASVSSQFVTALLLIAPFTKSGIHIAFTGIPVSRPYFAMTLHMLEYFNVKVKQKSNEVAVFPKKQLTGKRLIIEPDWTSASYWLGLASLFPGSQIHIPNLSKNSWQGDRALTSFLSRFGLNFNFQKDGGLHITADDNYPAEFEALLVDHPDLAPTLASLCTAAKIPFHFDGLSHLKHKETDRLEAIANELQKTGATVWATETALHGNQYEDYQGAPITLNTYEDHRLAMSWTLLAANDQRFKIDDPDVVEKSYPQFWEQLEALGFKLKGKPW